MKVKIYKFIRSKMIVIVTGKQFPSHDIVAGKQFPVTMFPRHDVSQSRYYPYNLEEKSKWELIQMTQELTQNNFK